MSNVSDADDAAMCARLLDDLIGANQHGPRDRDAESFRGPEVKDQLELGWLLHRQIAGLFALYDPIDVAGSLLDHELDIGPIRHEPALVDEVPPAVHRRHAAAPG